MKSPLDYSLSQFMDAMNRLREGATEAKDELDRDGVIQRFEFCFELLWKTLKVFLEDRGLEVRSPKDSLKASFGQGWITDEDAWQHIPLIEALAQRLRDLR